MTVPVAALGCSAMPTGRQQRTLYVYMSRSTSSPGAVKASATFSSITSTVPSSPASERSARDFDGPGHVVDRLEDRHEVVAALELGIAGVAVLEANPVVQSCSAAFARDLDGCLVDVEAVHRHLRVGAGGDARPAGAAGGVRDRGGRVCLEPLVHVRDGREPLRAEQVAKDGTVGALLRLEAFPPVGCPVDPAPGSECLSTAGAEAKDIA